MKKFFIWLRDLLTDPQKPAARVTFFGAIGGALAVAAGCVLGELTQDWYRLILPYLALGAGAAFIAVFVLIGTKTDDVLRCCGVALLAGFFWHPVFEAGKDYLLNQDDRQAAAETTKVTKRLDAVLENLAGSPTNAAYMERAGMLVETLTHETAELRRSPARTHAQFTLTRAMNMLGDQAERGNPVAAAAVISVAETAVASGNRAVIDKARLPLARTPDPTNALLNARRREIIIRLPPVR